MRWACPPNSSSIGNKSLADPVAFSVASPVGFGGQDLPRHAHGRLVDVDLAEHDVPRPQLVSGFLGRRGVGGRIAPGDDLGRRSRHQVGQKALLDRLAEPGIARPRAHGPERQDQHFAKRPRVRHRPARRSRGRRFDGERRGAAGWVCAGAATSAAAHASGAIASGRSAADAKARRFTRRTSGTGPGRGKSLACRMYGL